jgi:hypothetical protein
MDGDVSFTGHSLGGVIAGGVPAAGVVIDREVSGQPILPKAYGTRHALPNVPPAGAGFVARNNPVAEHGMDYVIRGIDAQRRQCGCA